MSAITLFPDLQYLTFEKLDANQALEKVKAAMESAKEESGWVAVPDTVLARHEVSYMQLAVNKKLGIVGVQTTLAPPPGRSTIRNYRVCQYIASNDELQKHPNLIKFYDFDVSTPSKIHCWMRLYEKGNIFQKALDENRYYRAYNVIPIAQAVGYALQALHRHSIVHRDVKVDNILTDISDDAVVLADYDLSYQFTQEERAKNEAVLLPACGSPPYCPPEIFLQKTLQLTFAQAVKIDVFELGMTIYHLGTSELPPWIEELTDQNDVPLVYQELEQDDVDRILGKPTLEPTLINLVRRLIVLDPAQRLSIRATLKELGAIDDVVDPNDRRRIDEED